MRALLPHAVHAVDIHEHYARDWVDHGGMRANMVVSADGAITADGRSRGLQTPGDNEVFAALRDLADVVLVGASTAEQEGYRPAQPDDERARFDFAPRLPIALVSRSLKLDLDGPLFRDAEARPYVLTCERADADAAAATAKVAEVVVCGVEGIDFGTARRELAARGHTRVLCEGGPRILGQLIGDGELDELCLSVTPLLAGPDAERMVAGDKWPGVPRRMLLTALLEEDGALFLRYTTRR